MEPRGCEGQHRFYVATDGAVENTGTVFVIIVCTSCGEAMKKEFKVAEGNQPISLSENKSKKE